MRPQKSGSRFCLYCQCQCKRPAATAHEGIDSEVSDGIPLPMQCRVLSCTRVICVHCVWQWQHEQYSLRRHDQCIYCRSWTGKPGRWCIQRIPNSWRLQPISCQCRLGRQVRFAATGRRVCSTKSSGSLAGVHSRGRKPARYYPKPKSAERRRHHSGVKYAGAAGLAGAFTACLVAAVLAFATRLIQHMPHNAQGAIVLSGVAGILQFGEAAFLWRVRPFCQQYSRCDANMRASCSLAGRLAVAGATILPQAFQM